MAKDLKKYKVLPILMNVSHAVSSSLDLGEVNKLILKESMAALGADHASLFVRDRATGHLILAQARGFTRDEMANIRLLGSWEVINEQLVRKKKRSFIINDVRKHRTFKDKKLPFFHEKMPIRSFLAVPLEKDNEVIGVLIVSNRKRPGFLFTKQDEKLMVALSNHVAIALQNARLYEDLKDLFLSTVKALVRAIEAKDTYTKGHSERVMKYSLAIGRELGLPEERLQNLGLSSLLHDVGKIGVAERVLLKQGKLSIEEKGEINMHPLIGSSIVSKIDGARKLTRGILEHHERYDGKGYPNGLKGDRISLEGRIIAVADTYDAITTTRPYRDKYPGKSTIFEISSGSNGQFDPAVVKAFLKSFSKHPEVWKVLK